ncbi:TFIIH/NER complex subunit [Actinomortierella wolfii]|nr:TFIIH/NER complex subunit [Actinomortierella wolfii]
MAASRGTGIFDDDVCPVCQTDRYLNPHMKLLVGPCFHKMFNKRPEDFKTLKAYNDYLEEVEDLTFKLVNEIDVEATKLAIEKFAQENRELIRMNADRLLEESRWASYVQEQQRKEKAAQREAYLNELKAEEAAKAEQRKSFIQELATSDKSAKAIVAQRQHQVTLKKTSMRRMDAAKASPSLGSGGTQGSTTSTSVNGASALSMSEAYWKAQEEALRQHMHEEEDDMDVDFDPIQSQYMDVELGAGYVQSVNHNMAHGGGLQYPLLTSSTGIKDLYVEPKTMDRVYVRAGGYRPIFGYTRAIEDAHTALFEAAL